MVALPVKKWRLKLTSAKVVVEVEAELDNTMAAYENLLKGHFAHKNISLLQSSFLGLSSILR